MAWEAPKVGAMFPFPQCEPPPSRKWWELLFFRGRPYPAIDEIYRCSRETWPAVIAAETAKAVSRRFGLSKGQFRQVAIHVYSAALTSFTSDAEITDSEADYLRQLKHVLALTPNEISEIDGRVVYPHYERLLREVLGDSRISSEDLARMNKLARQLRLDVAAQQSILEELAGPILRKASVAIRADRRVSPQEMDAVKKLADDLMLIPESSKAIQEELELFQLYWQIENGPMPWYHVGIALQKGEKCHYAGAASWNEVRAVSRVVTYRGLTNRIRIMKGLYYRSGAIKATSYPQLELTNIDTGTVYITNKRVIFDGGSVNKTVTLSSLLGIEVFSDGIGLEKANGRNPVIGLAGNIEHAAIVLSALLAKH